MDVKQAVAVAKSHVADLFSDEGITALGLEAVEFDDTNNAWKITIGFSREWDTYAPIGTSALSSPGLRRTRSYKIVRIADNNGKILSVDHRIFV